MNQKIDILMITYNRPFYTNISLKRLLDTCDSSMRVWVWHNGDDKKTLEVVSSYRSHPKFYKFHHSKQNLRLNMPTNWLWENSDSNFFSKVDDDCIVPYGWANKLIDAHKKNDNFGVIGCWSYLEEDFNYELSKNKIFEYNGGCKILRNCWVGGSGYVLKRKCVERFGLLKTNESFTHYCIKLALENCINGWYYPFLFQEHMDDPRSKNSLLKNDNDIKVWQPLSAKNNGIDTIAGWIDLFKSDAEYLQKCSYDPKFYSGWRRMYKAIKLRIRHFCGDKKKW